MAREILFRGKRTDNGEWVVGSLIALPTGEYEIGKKCVNPPDSDPMWRKILITYKVIPETIGQYTGLTDKNGKKIFEGDIVNTYNGTKTLKELEKISYKGISFIGIIKWNLTEARFYLEHLDGIKWHLKNDRFYEVIGNIHDNPELIERGCDNG